MIRVGFSHSKGLISRLIMAFTRRPYSHCWLLLDDTDMIRGVPVVLEEVESGGGLHIIPWNGYSKDKTIVKIVVPPYSLDKGVDALMHKLGTKYDYKGLVGQSYVVLIKRWFNRKVKNPFANSKRMWCSEAIIWAMQRCDGYENADNFDPETSTPGDLYDLLAMKQ